MHRLYDNTLVASVMGSHSSNEVKIFCSKETPHLHLSEKRGVIDIYHKCPRVQQGLQNIKKNPKGIFREEKRMNYYLGP